MVIFKGEYMKTLHYPTIWKIPSFFFLWKPWGLWGRIQHRSVSNSWFDLVRCQQVAQVASPKKNLQLHHRKPTNVTFLRGHLEEESRLPTTIFFQQTCLFSVGYDKITRVQPLLTCHFFDFRHKKQNTPVN